MRNPLGVSAYGNAPQHQGRLMHEDLGHFASRPRSPSVICRKCSSSIAVGVGSLGVEAAVVDGRGPVLTLLPNGPCTDDDAPIDKDRVNDAVAKEIRAPLLSRRW